MAQYKKIQNLTETINEKVSRKISYNQPDYVIDPDLIDDLITEAVEIIRDWRRLNGDDSELLSGMYDGRISQYVMESLNKIGIEGQVASSANGTSKTFSLDPRRRLLSSIPQRL